MPNFVALAKVGGDDNHYIDRNIRRRVTLLHTVKVKCGYIYLIASRKPEAYRQRTVDLVHSALVKLAHSLLEPLFVKRSYLLEQYYRILCKTATVGVYRNVGRKPRFVLLACYGGGNDSRAVAVAHIVLDNKYGAHTALFASDNGAQICVIYLSSFYKHGFLPFC